MPQACDILITGAYLVPVRPARCVLYPGSVAITGGRLVAVGPSGELDDEYLPKRLIDATGCALLPGFVNVHASDSPLPSPPFEETPQARIPDRERNAEEALAGEWTCAEFLLAGITTFAAPSLHSAAGAQLVEKFGLRAVLAAPASRDKKESINPCLSGEDGALIIWAHGVSCSGPGALRQLTQALLQAREAELPLHVDLSAIPEGEVWDAMARLLESEELPSASRLVEPASLPPPLLDALQARSTGIVHCPSMRARLGRGTLPLDECQQAGAIVGLGTGASVLAGRHDPFEEMRLAVFFSRLPPRERGLSAWDALEIATLGGAQLLGLSQAIGSIESGKQADLILVDLAQPHFEPLLADALAADQIVADLVFSAGAADVKCALVRGVPVMERRKPLGRISHRPKPAANRPTALNELH